MSGSDKISILALIVAIISLYLSIRNDQSNKKLIANEKQTETVLTLLDTRMEVGRAIFRVQELLRSGTLIPDSPDKLIEIEAGLLRNEKSIHDALTMMRSFSSEDPLLMEQYKSHAIQMKLITQNLTLMVDKLIAEAQPEDPWGEK